MHSVDGSLENPVKSTLKTGGLTIKIESPKIRINTGTKIYKYGDNALLGGAGNYEKIEKYKKALDQKQYDEWESSFLTKLAEMYKDVSKYDDAVSSDLNFLKLEKIG